MHKTTFDLARLNAAALEGDWMDLDKVAQVAVTSEDPNYPVESALISGLSSGWRAGGKGEQTIRLIFDPPQRLKRICLRFVESETERTQQFLLRWRADKDGLAQEIIRQQWNFSPVGSTTEIEDYKVDLDNVGVLELIINPDLDKRAAIATLAEWRMA